MKATVSASDRRSCLCAWPAWRTAYRCHLCSRVFPDDGSSSRCYHPVLAFALGPVQRCVHPLDQRLDAAIWPCTHSGIAQTRTCGQADASTETKRLQASFFKSQLGQSGSLQPASNARAQLPARQPLHSLCPTAYTASASGFVRPLDKRLQ